ncbi:MAG: GDSL-type esterase/lipase family protein [Clostridiales Family XIII bacterium]|nr:GDSL-type esterase/lipase family protein [Clostridiales Family XIII bacterium]
MNNLFKKKQKRRAILLAILLIFSSLPLMSASVSAAEYEFANFNTAWLGNNGISPGSYGGANGVIVLNNGGGFWGSIGNAGTGLATGNNTRYEVDLYFNAARTPGSAGAYWGFVGPSPVRETYDSAGGFGTAVPAVDTHGVNMDYTKQALNADGTLADIAWAPIDKADGEYHVSDAYTLHDLPITTSNWDFGILINNLPTNGRIYIKGFMAVVHRDAAAGGDVSLKWGDIDLPSESPPDKPPIDQPSSPFAYFNASWLNNGGISPGSYGGADNVIVLNNGGGFYGSIGAAGTGLVTGPNTKYEVDLYFNAARTPGSEGAYWGFAATSADNIRETYNSRGRLGLAGTTWPFIDDNGINMDYTKQALKDDGTIDDIAWAPIDKADGKFHVSDAYRLYDLPVTTTNYDFAIMVNKLPANGRIYIMGLMAVVHRDAAAGGDVILKWGDMTPPEDKPPIDQDHTLKIVCVGDSITNGDLGYSDASHSSYGQAGTDSYPSTLGKLFGSGYQVLNRGLPGACINVNGEMPYWTWDGGSWRRSSGEDYQPDVVLFLMGGNDSHNGNWPRLGSTDTQRETNFKASLRTYIDYYLGLDSKPFVVMGSTIGCLSPTEYTNNNERTNIIVQWEKEVANEAAYRDRVLFIDENTWSMADTSIFNPYDHVHLTRAGYIARANNIYNFLQEELTPELTVTPPTKLTYAAGEALDLAGAKLRADFGGGHIADFAVLGSGASHPGVTVSGYDADQLGLQTVTLDYWGQTAAFDVMIPSDVAINSFSINGVEGAVSNTYRTIHITLPAEYGLTSLTPAFTLPQGLSVSPTGAHDFTTPQTYDISAADGTKISYTVTVSLFDAALSAQRAIRVYCIGDSITRGAGASNDSATYPRQLQSKLDAKYGVGKFTVRNGGRDGYGAQRNTIYPAPTVGSGWYGKTSNWNDVVNFQPDLVIYAIGANNAKNGGSESSWVDEATFRTDYRELLDMTLELPTHPLVIVGTSLRAKGNGNFSISPSIIADSIVPIQRAIAEEYGLGVVDGYDFSESLLANGYSGDNIHLNDTGYEAVSQWYFNALSAVYDGWRTFVSLEANGSADTATTTELTLTFSQAIPGLTADNISLSGGAAKGALSGSGAVYKLAVSGISAEGAGVTVSVAPPAGYTIVPASLSTVVHKEAVIDVPDVPDVPVFADENGNELQHLTSKILITNVSHINESGGDVNLTLYVALYKPDGKLLRIIRETQDDIGNGEVANFIAQLDMPENNNGVFVTEGYYVNVFIWDSDTFIPVVEKYKFN